MHLDCIEEQALAVRARAATVIAFATLFGAIGCGGSDEPAALKTTIVFSASGGGGRAGIYLVQGDGSRLRRITADAPPKVSFELTGPAVSPDGTRLLFEAEEEDDAGEELPVVWTINVDGTSARRLAAGYSPRWAPDGRAAFIHNDEIVILGSGGKREAVPLRLAEAEYFGDTPYGFSPDGTRLFVLTMSEEPEGSKLSVLRLGDGRRKVLASAEREFDIDQAAWAPSGDLIAFTIRRGGRRELVAMRPEDASPQTLAPGAKAFSWLSPTRLIYLDRERHLRILELRSGGAVGRTIALSSPSAFAIEASPAGNRAAVFDEAGVVSIWDLAGRKVGTRSGVDGVGWLPGGDQLVLVDRGLFVIADSRGRTITALTPAPVNEEPRWSPRGDQLLYLRHDGETDPSDASRIEIVVADAAGRGARVVARGAHASWSPDGNTIAYDRNGDLFILEGNHAETRITRGRHLDSAPIWSPQGKQIAFTRATIGHNDRGPGQTVCIAATATRTATCSDLRQSGGLGDIGDPAWSHDGRLLAFTYAVEEPGTPGRVAFSKICTLGAGSGRECLAHNVEDVAFPVLSPTRDQLAATATIEGEIQVTDLRGNVIATAGGEGAVWSPDGKRLAFSRGILDISTNASIEIEADGSPAWSPDGEWLAYAAGRELILIDPAGNEEPRRLATARGDIQDHAWRPAQ